MHLLFGTDKQAIAYAKANGLTTDKNPIAVDLTGFQSEEGAPEHFSGETNALIVRDNQDKIVGYLAYWESEF